MTSRVLTVIAVVAFALLTIPMEAVAQRVQPYSHASLFYIYNTWTEDIPDFGEQKLSEGAFGLKMHQLLGNQAVFDLWGSFASAKYSDDGDNDASLSSINDTRVAFTLFLEDRQWSIAAIANLPTGKKELEEEEAMAVFGLSDNSRRYVVRRFGEGLDFGGEALFRPHTESFESQFGGGYLHKGKFQVLKSDEEKYKFGDEIYATAGVSTFSEPVSVRGGVTYKMYMKDQAGDVDVFQAGPSIIVDGRVMYNRGIQGSAGIVIISRGKGEIPEGGSGDFVEEPEKSGRDEIGFDAGLNIPVGGPLGILGRIEHVSLSANDYDENSPSFRPEASHTGFGGGLSYIMSLNWSGNILGMFYTGSAADDNDLSGFGITAVLTYRYW